MRILFFCIGYLLSSTSAFTQGFTEEEIYIRTKKDSLGGILSIPFDCEKCPAVLIIQGSGPTDKDGNSAMLNGKNNSLKLLSETLNRAGIATLRYDKRGVGMSKKAFVSEQNLIFDDFVSDAEDFLKYLIKDKRFKRIGVVGHSQGSLIGMLISQNKKVKAFASIAGPSFSIDNTLLTQIKANPYNPPQLIKEAEDITVSLKNGIAIDSVSPYLLSIYRPSIQLFMMSWMKYDPTEEISKLKSPVLVINGSTDLQINVEDAQRLQISNEKAELVIIEGMNHVLKNAKANALESNASYSNPALPLNEEFQKEIIAFFTKNLKK